MNPNIYVFLHPSDKHRANRFGFGSCLLGWKTEKDALLCPKKKTKCELLHIDVSSGCGGTAEIIVEEAKKLGAKGVFLDADFFPPETKTLAEELAFNGLSVFTSADVKEAACSVVTEKGENRFVSPRMQKTTISITGKCVKSQISRSELDALIEKLSPKKSYSEELGSYYFSSKNRSETVFVVYDTPETFRQRLYSCNAKNIFLTMSSVKEYLADIK